MIFYHATDVDGRLHLAATQAEAKAISKNFEQTDVPTDKPNLQKFVQQLYDDIFFAKWENPCETNTPAPATDATSDAKPETDTSSDTFTDGGSNTPAAPSPRESYVAWSIKMDEVFPTLPLAHQLHFAAMAMENARSLVTRPIEAEPEAATV